MNNRVQQVGAYLVIQGAEFSPSRAEAALGVDFGPEKNEPGDIGAKGKFMGKPIPYGHAWWEFSWEKATETFLPTSLEVFNHPGLAPMLKSLGADEITLHVHVGYREQCNFELDTAVLTRLATLGVTVAVSCYLLEECD